MTNQAISENNVFLVQPKILYILFIPMFWDEKKNIYEEKWGFSLVVFFFQK